LLVLLIAPAPAGAAVICAGDCNYDGRAGIGELVTGVNIAEEKEMLSVCPAFDPSGNGSVEIDELVGGVHNGLTGCPAARFAPETCDPLIVPQGQDPANLTCGTVIVPENRAHREAAVERPARSTSRSGTASSSRRASDRTWCESRTPNADST
jgi:hypothetical protein